MPTADHYDHLSLGCGEAGKFITWHTASTGKRAAVIERKYPFPEQSFRARQPASFP